jgi:succinate dehydrogenase flavin-adding protein (antitoxin of CptAB toxin-antitoxin module)
MASSVQQAYVVSLDGQNHIFATKAEADLFVRRPKILKELLEVTDDNTANWLIENQDSVESCFETGTIKRVTKAEKAQLEKAIEAIVASGDSRYKFVIDHAAVILEVFRWPTVKRMTDEEKLVASKNGLLNVTENNQTLTDWILKNKDSIMAAYKAGVEKREVSPQAANGLLLYRFSKALEKAVRIAANGEPITEPVDFGAAAESEFVKDKFDMSIFSEACDQALIHLGLREPEEV